VRILCCVGEGFRCHVIGGDLDRLGEPPFDRDFEVDGNRRAAREGSQRDAKSALGEVRRVDAARDLLEFGGGVDESGCDLRQLGVQVDQVGRRNPLLASTDLASITAASAVPVRGLLAMSFGDDVQSQEP
jgi:hypothetical protein